MPFPTTVWLCVSTAWEGRRFDYCTHCTFRLRGKKLVPGKPYCCFCRFFYKNTLSALHTHIYMLAALVQNYCPGCSLPPSSCYCIPTHTWLFHSLTLLHCRLPLFYLWICGFSSALWFLVALFLKNYYCSLYLLAFEDFKTQQYVGTCEALLCTFPRLSVLRLLGQPLWHAACSFLFLPAIGGFIGMSPTCFRQEGLSDFYDQTVGAKRQITFRLLLPSGPSN